MPTLCHPEAILHSDQMSQVLCGPEGSPKSPHRENGFIDHCGQYSHLFLADPRDCNLELVNPPQKFPHRMVLFHCYSLYESSLCFCFVLTGLRGVSCRQALFDAVHIPEEHAKAQHEDDGFLQLVPVSQISS